MITFTTIVFIWIINIMICSFIHAFKDTRMPETLWEFFKLTFLPYVIIHWKNLKK